MLRYFSLVILIVGLFACKNSPDRPEQILEEGYQPTEITTAPPAAPSPTTAPQLNEPPQNAEGVWHYTCPNGCAGGAGAATPCGSCGTTLVHNQAYHSGGASTTISNPVINPQDGQKGSITNPIVNGVNTPSAIPGAPGAPPALGAPTGQPPAPEPPQNAKGVWHYTCPNGCDGGSGSATPCSGCGTTLVHNTVYHQ